MSEVGTVWVQGLTTPTAGHSLFLVRITSAEVVAAVTRRERGGEFRGIDSSLTLISADGDLNAAALAEGMLVEDPNHHP